MAERGCSVETYVRKAIEAEITKFETSGDDRNSLLNSGTFACGALYAGARDQGVTLDATSIKSDIVAAAERCGYAAKHGKRDTRYTIDRSFRDGERQPRDLSHVGAGNGRAKAPPAPRSKPADSKPHRPAEPASGDDLENLKRARLIWDAASPIAGTIAEKYLCEARGIVDLNKKCRAPLRFHAATPLGLNGVCHPALIAALSDTVTGEFRGAIQRTFLAPDGTGKATEIGGSTLSEAKISLGKRAPSDAVVFGKLAGVVIVAEGIEDALSARLATGLPAVAVLTRGRLGTIELPDGCSILFAAQAKNDADRDAWREQAQIAANRGLKVKIAWPGDCKDFNDLLLAEGHRIVARELNNAETVKGPDPFEGLCSLADPRSNMELDYIVKGLLPRGAIGQILGQSGGGKSVFGPFLGCCVALGRELFDRKTRGGPVLYVNYESSAGFRLRVEAIAASLGLSAQDRERLEKRFMWIKDQPFLGTGKDGDEGERQLQELIEKAGQRAGEPIALVILDTFSKAIAGEDHKDSPAVTGFIGRKRKLAQATGATILDIHHPNKKDGKGGPGGAGQQVNDNEVIWQVVVPGYEQQEEAPPIEARREVRVFKNQNGRAGYAFSAFTLALQEIGTDSDGDPIQMPILTLCDADDSGNAKSKRMALSGHQQEALNAFNHCEGRRVTNDRRDGRSVPDGAYVVSEGVLYAACEKQGIGSSNQKDPKEREKAIERAITRALTGLLDKGCLCRLEYSGEVVYWRPDQVRGQAGSTGVKVEFADDRGIVAGEGQPGSTKKVEPFQGGVNRGQAGSNVPRASEDAPGSTARPPLRGAPGLTPHPSDEAAERNDAGNRFGRVV